MESPELRFQLGFSLFLFIISHHFCPLAFVSGRTLNVFLMFIIYCSALMYLKFIFMLCMGLYVQKNVGLYLLHLTQSSLEVMPL